jgi:lipoprotein NlpD
LPAPSAGPAPAPDSAVPRLSEPRAQTVPFSAEALAQWQKPPGATKDKPVAATDPKPAADAKAKDGKTPSAAAPASAAVPAVKDAAGKEPAAGAKEGAARESPAREVTAKAGTERDEDDEALEWTWPVRGDLLYRFGDSGRLKGVGIGGRVGQPVAAAASGRVVYAGSGLRGYGRMVIVKHNETYLSVYAHNSALLVKEGDGVKRGQKIAEMGDSDAPRVGLHFEVRRFGRPIDPLGRLPGL